MKRNAWNAAFSLSIVVVLQQFHGYKPTTTQEPTPPPRPCSFSPGNGMSAIDLDHQLKSNLRSASDDCIAVNKNHSLEVVMRSVCSNDVKFENYRAQCPKEAPKAKLAVAEFSANSSEISRYMREMKNQYLNQNQTRVTVLPPVGNKLLSFCIVQPNGSKTESVEVSFSCELPYKKLFRENAYDLTFDSNENGHFLRTTYRYISHQPKGVYIDESTMTFETAGCGCTDSGRDVADCTSNHTTVFAVLLSVDSVKIPRSVKILSIATHSISILFLFVAFVILIQVRKRVRGDRIPIQINLTISLLLLNFCLIWGDIAVQIPPFCRAIAVLTHFFLLSTALWMMNEANLLFVKTSNWAFSATKRRKVVMVTMLLGWGLSAIITIITAAIGFGNDLYMEQNSFNIPDSLGDNTNIASNGLQYEHCWLNSQNGMRWAAIGPVGTILVYNLIMAMRAAFFVYQKRIEAERYMPSEQVDENKRKMEQLKNIFHSLKAIFLLLPVLGLPWIMLLAANSGLKTVQLSFMYVNTVINGLQGVFVFIIYCVVDNKVKEATKKNISSLGDTWHSNSPTRLVTNATHTNTQTSSLLQQVAAKKPTST